jgi:Spx/MgsR family transcriptional regulator
MTTLLYGIPNCDTVKKSQKWLSQNNIPFVFHDYRKDGLDSSLIKSFLENLEWTELLNKRSTSYRQLTEQQKASLSAETVIDLLVEFPTLIKRPILIHNNQYLLGFKADTYHTLFSL